MYIDEGFGNVEIATDSGESRSQKKKQTHTKWTMNRVSIGCGGSETGGGEMRSS